MKDLGSALTKGRSDGDAVLESTGKRKGTRGPLYDATNGNDASHASQRDDFRCDFLNVDQLFPQNDVEACDNAVRNGTCESVVHRLRDVVALTKREKASGKAYEKAGLQLAIICNALARMMECSDESLEKYVPFFADDLGLALPEAIRYFVDWNGDSTSRFVALGCSVHVLQRVAPMCIDHMFDFAQSLSLLLGYDIPSDVRVDAACTLTGFLGVDRANLSVHCKIEQEASAIISVLSTAALTNNNRNATHRLQIMLLLAQDPILSGKLRRRRCVTIALAKQLKQECLECQDLALEIISFLLKDEEIEPKSATAVNMNLMVEQLEGALHEERCRPSRIRIIHNLLYSIGLPAIERKRKLGILNTLYDLLRADGVPSKVQFEASLAFLSGINKTNAYAELLSELSIILVSPLAEIRRKAMRELDDAFFWHAESLCEHPDLSDLLDSLCILISNGSPEDCANAMQLCRQIAAKDAAKAFMCQHKLFLLRLVSLVSTVPVRNRPAYINAVEVMLTLLESDERLIAFLSFSEVLPCMVSLANRTSDDALRARLVSTVLRFAKATLENRSSK